MTTLMEKINSVPNSNEPTVECSNCFTLVSLNNLRARSLRMYEKAILGKPILCLDCELTKKMTKKLKTDEKRTFCSYCGVFGKMTKEHVVPRYLLKKFKLNCEFIVPACRSCNFHKGSMLLTEWFETFPESAIERENIQKILGQLIEICPELRNFV